MPPSLTPYDLLSARLTLHDGAIHWWVLHLEHDTPTRRLGKPAGGIVGGRLVVSIDGAPVPATRIAWALHYGEWPAHDVHTLDRDPRNMAAGNLAEGPAPRKPRAPKYQAGMLDDPEAYWAMQKAEAARIGALRVSMFGTINTTPEQDAQVFAAAYPAPAPQPQPEDDDPDSCLF